MVTGNDGDAGAGRARGGMLAGYHKSPPRRRPGVAVAAVLAAAAGLAACGGASYRPPASATGKAPASAGPSATVRPPGPSAATGATSPPGATRPAGLTPDVTLAYFRHGVGLVGVSPHGAGGQGDKPSTLWLTTDSGRHWRDITPPGARRGAGAGSYPFFADASFLNPTTGWVTTWNAATIKVTMYSTSDGGASWTVVGHSVHSENAGAADLIQLVTPRLAFSETLEPTGPGMDLRVTADGGRSWRDVYSGPPPRQAGGQLAGPFLMPMVFLSASRGFAADGIPPADPVGGAGHGDLFATSDGGRTWVRESPPLAAPSSTCAASPGNLTGNATSCLVGLPVFTSATQGVLPSEVLTRTSATVGFAVTSDSGHTWTLAATLRVPLPERPAAAATSPARYALTALPSASVRWVLAAARHGVTSWVSTDSGRNWSAASSAVRGIPLALQAADASHAWLTTQVSTSAGSGQVLYATSDGGRSWHQVIPG